MKKALIISLMMLATIGYTYSQNEVDALRYSQSFLTGTARSVSMGGAFGSLGGNFSSVAINPAGIGIYRSSEFSITPSFSYNLSTSEFNGNTYEDFKYDFELSNMSLVGTVKSKSDNGWKSTSFGFGYNRTNNFDMNMAIKDYNASSSLLDEWVNDANNGNWFNLGNELGEDADLIYNNPNTQMWESDFTGSDYGQYQSRTISTTGSAGEYTFALGANYDNMVYIGGSFSLNTVYFKEQTNHHESEIPEDIDYLNSFSYKNYLETRGTGAGFKIGAIVKPIDWVRLGLSIHSPIFYSLRDEYSSYLSADISYSNGTYDASPVQLEGAFDYNIVTPFKAISSIAFIINKFAIISFDYEFVDYTKARLRDAGNIDNSYDFDVENSNIQEVYTATGNLKAGAEFRFGPISLRGGYSYYGSPYASGQINEDADYSILSGGFGINSNKLYFDLAYSYITNSQSYVMYHYPETTGSIANIDYVNSQVMATIGLRF